MGRPLKLTKDRAQTIVTASRVGATRRAAAAAAGVSRSTLQTWLSRGEVSNAPALYRNFAKDVREADAACEIRALVAIRRAADSDWKAAAWILEHCRSDYGARHEVTGPDGGPLEVEGTWNLGALSDKELAALQELTAKAGAG